MEAEELRKQFDAFPLPEKAGCIGASTTAFVEFSNRYVKPVLLGIKDLSEMNLVLRSIYFRIHMQMQSLAFLVAAPHFQAAMMITRNMLELCIDLFVIAKNPNMLGKYLAFPEIERFNYAEKRLKYLNNNPTVDKAPHKLAIDWASDPQRIQSIKKLRIQYWGKTKKDQPVQPNGWSNLTVVDLAAKAGIEFEELYRKMYAPCSWYVHGGAAGYLDLPADGYCTMHGDAHLNAQDILERAIRKVDEIFQLSTGNLQFYEDLYRVRQQYGVRIYEAIIDRAEEVLKATAHQEP